MERRAGGVAFQAGAGGQRGERRTELAAFLYYGYRPRIPAGYRELPWSRVRADEEFTGLERDELIARGTAALRAACGLAGEGLHVVPLSGGVDSRLLLGLLVERVPRERLRAVTFGVPGALDFDLAPSVARAAGVRHEAIDLSGYPVTRDELLAVARAVPWTFVYEAYYNHLIPRLHGPEATYWSGCMANTFAGADLDVLPRTMPEAHREFVRWTRVVRSVALTPEGFDPADVLPERPLLEHGALTLFEQLHAYLRYPGFNEPILLAPGYTWRTPFRAPAWVDFMLRVPLALRADPSFYRGIARAAAPVLFSLPTKNDLGLAPGVSPLRHALRRARFKLERGLRRSFPGHAFGQERGLNYADFDHELRTPTPLRDVVEDSLRRLRDLGVLDWLDPVALWVRHQRRRANLGVALILLSALELNLAAEVSPAPRRGPGGPAAPPSG